MRRIFSRRRLEQATWEELEEDLVLADLGVPLAARTIERLKEAAKAGKATDVEAKRELLAALLAELAGGGPRELALDARPAVVMVVGVNGSGKTTTAGKLAWKLVHERGMKVVLGAADTFRAAAIEQLGAWVERAGCEAVTAEPGADPGAVAFDTVAAAVARGADVAIVDTAGRLHTSANLMAELEKVHRAVGKRLDGAPHEVLLTIDATTGQNGIAQAQGFCDAAGVTGVALTKLDGTAKGGVALRIAEELGVPVKLIGVGERPQDLRPFDPLEFARALVAE